LKFFRYTRKENGASVDKTIIRKKTGRPRKYKLNIQERTAKPMSAHRRKPELKAKKANNKEQESEVKGFIAPEGKKLVKIDKNTYVYR
jgi:post-segregation antitoxin (ccd killing protein)